MGTAMGSNPVGGLLSAKIREVSPGWCGHDSGMKQQTGPSAWLRVGGLVTGLLVLMGVVVEGIQAADGFPRFTSYSSTEAGVFRMGWSGATNQPYAVEASDALGPWEPIQAVIGMGGNGHVEDLDAVVRPHRLYRISAAGSGLVLPTGSLHPGAVLRVSVPELDPAAAISLMFQDSRGLVTAVPARATGSSEVMGIVPVILDPDMAGYWKGPMTVWMQERGSAGGRTVVSGQAALLEPLPESALSTGALTLGYLVHLEALLSRAGEEWVVIGQASEGSVDTGPIISRLAGLKASVASAREEILRVVTGQEPRWVIGRVSGQEWVLDPEGIRALDRMIGSFLARPIGSWEGAAGMRSASILEEGCGDSMACLDGMFAGSTGPDTGEILQFFDRMNSIAGAGVAVAAASAVILGLASAPAAVAMAGTAGAALFFAAYVAPAVMAASSQAVAAPFIEARAGRMVSVDDYRPALEHVRKGSEAFLFEELQGRLLNGVLGSRGAGGDLTARLELMVGSSRALLGELNPAIPDTVGFRAYQRSEEIMGRLLGPTDSVTFVGAMSGSVTESQPDAGWRHDIGLNVSIRVRGRGTLLDPYVGTLRVVGTDRISLVYCLALGGCDPGGTLSLQMDGGVVSGVGGRVEAEGMVQAGSGEFPLALEDGVIDATGLTGVLVVDLGVDEVLVREVRLLREP